MLEMAHVRRTGPYSGAVGHLSGDGNMDMAIAIRTAVIKDGQVHVQAGAGVVADSKPEAEWDETMNKARALMRAAELTTSPSPLRGGARGGGAAYKPLPPTPSRRGRGKS